MAVFLHHTACTNLECGSSDAGAVYDDGSAYCHICSHYWRLDGTESDPRNKTTNDKTHSFLTGTFKDITNRGLYEKTCEKYGYSVAEDASGVKCHVANYRDPKTGQLIAQKVRKAGKEFSVIGVGKDMPLFGQHLWGAGGKSVVITEGEIDALSVAQAFDCKWPVVSLPNGAQSALKAIKSERAYEWLCSYDKVVIAFDGDKPGQDAALAVAEALPMGKAYILSYPEGCKDANDVLKAHGTSAITRCFWDAKPYRPDGIKAIGELRTNVLNPEPVVGIPYPWPEWNLLFKAIRPGKLMTITSGSGLGKSTTLRELAYYLAVEHNIPIGCMFLEESNEETVEILMGIHLNKNIFVNPEVASQSEKNAAFDVLDSKGIYLWDHFGSNHIDAVLSKMYYMANALEVQYIFLDHVSILVSGMEDGDERKTIDLIMTKLRTFCEETGVGIFLVSHLKRPSGDKGHEDGAPVTLGQLRGSAAIGQLSDGVIGLQKNPDDPTSDEVIAVSLKNRLTGKRGHIGSLFYSSETGRLTASSF